jgi:hypothetical protein
VDITTTLLRGEAARVGVVAPRKHTRDALQARLEHALKMGDACRTRRGQKQQAHFAAANRLTNEVKTQEDYGLKTRSGLEGVVVDQIRISAAGLPTSRAPGRRVFHVRGGPGARGESVFKRSTTIHISMSGLWWCAALRIKLEKAKGRQAAVRFWLPVRSLRD